MNKFRWILIAVLVMVTVGLFAEEIQLKDGSKISGKIVGVSGDTFQVKTNYGDISVPRSDVVSITFPENAPKKDDAALPPIDEELKDQSYTNRTAGFQVTVPKGWKLAPELRSSKDVVAALSSPDDALFLMVTPEKFSGSLATYKVLAEAQYQKNFSDFMEDADSEAQIDGVKGIRVTWHGTSKANNTDGKFLVYILPYEGRMLRLTFFTLPPLFSENVGVFEKMAASYHSIQKSN